MSAPSPQLEAKYAVSPFARGPWLLLVGLFLALYGWGDYSQLADWKNVDAKIPVEKLSTLGYLVRRWLTDESVTHGWLVLPIALAVVWYKRERLRQLPLSSHPGGLWVMALALLMHLAERVLDVNGPSAISVPLYLAGATWYLAGTAWLRELAFPLAYLLFMVPVPGGLTQIVTFPLRMLATEGSRWIVEHLTPLRIAGSGMNMEFWRPGTDTSDPQRNFVALIVADPCSGIHSLMAIKALHAITAYLSRLRLGWKWVLFFCALPITLAANVCRMTLILLVSAYIDKQFGLTLFHHYSPYVLFLFVFLILVSIGRGMERLTGGGKWWEARQAQEAEARAAMGKTPDWQRNGRAPGPLRPILLTGAVLAASLYFFARPQSAALAADVTALPLKQSDWEGVDRPQDDQTMKQQEADSYLYRRYINRRTGHLVDLLVVYRRYGRREFAHRPDQCYPAGGYVIRKKDTILLPWARRDNTAVRLDADGSRVQYADGKVGVPDETVSYFFVSGNRSEHDFLRQQLWMALERLMPNKNGWTFVRIGVPHERLTAVDPATHKGVFAPIDEAEATRVQSDFLASFGDELRRLITTDPATAGKEGP